MFIDLIVRFAALYGKAYIPAAKDTWKLFKDRGIDALVNDSLVGMSRSPRLLNLEICRTNDAMTSSDVGSIRHWTSLVLVHVSIPSQ